MKKVIYATNNLGKASELKQAMAFFQIDTLELLSLVDLELALPSPIESGTTYLENAQLKARYYAEQLQLPVIADDGGLELADFPDILGVKTQRFFKSRDPLQQNEELLALFADQPTASRVCTLRATLVYRDGEVEYQAAAALSGEISVPKGMEGYGFDPIIFLPEKGKTLAELSQRERFLLSPRVQAFQILLEELT